MTEIKEKVSYKWKWYWKLIAIIDLIGIIWFLITTIIMAKCPLIETATLERCFQALWW